MLLGVKNGSFRGVIWTKEIFFWQFDTCCFLNERWTLLQKFVKEVSPEIAILGSSKSGQEKLIFSPFTQEQLQIHDGTKNRLNRLSYRLLEGIVRGTNEIRAFLEEMILFKTISA